MDEFAQTRGGDDLFDDDFTPISEPIPETIEPELESPTSQKKAAPRGRGSRRSDNVSRRSQTQSSGSGVQDNSVEYSSIDLSASSQNDQESGSTTQHQPRPQPKANTAVRGDRTATGGTLKPKLTEDELSAKLAAAKLNNAKRAEAHRLAEADEASFQKREAMAIRKRQEEGQSRRQMDQEREKNRLRKLGAQGGREWDEGKEELATRDERGSQYRRGINGGIEYDAGRGRGGRNGYQDEAYEQDLQERRGGYSTRGRRRGDRGRGNRGRGGPHPTNSSAQAPPDPVADFPALPSGPQSMQKPQPATKEEQLLSPVPDGASWADEVAAKAMADS
ncbi:hypothetical protein MMC21_001057 [Puttea exsequens]|nr:hypothetical protein [Puttea exsequens]